jgi:ribose transport system permease protein
VNVSATTARTLQRLTRIPPAYFVFVLLVVVLWIARPQLFNINVMGVFIRQVAPLGIVVLGQLLVMNVRSIDLSAGGIILLVNYYISSSIFGDVGALWLVVLSLATGLGFGLFNGLMVGKRRASAVIVTLAVNMILIGIVQYLANGKPPGNVPKFFNEIYNTKLLAIPTPIIFWTLLSALMAVFLSRFVFGRFVASIGENPTAAHFSGVPVERTVIVAHTISGLMAALAGLVQTASIAVGSVRFGTDLAVNAVAATILGGVIFGRGDGGVWGPFFGVLSFALLFVVMTTFGVQEPGKLVAQGLIILLAAIFYGLRRQRP